MKTFADLAVVACAACLWATPGWATGALYNDPADGWLCAYENAGTDYGSALAGIFDTVTNHPGGRESQTDGGVTDLRIQDPGDPRDQVFPT